MSDQPDDGFGPVAFTIQDVFVHISGEVVVVGEVGEVGLAVGTGLVAHFPGERHAMYTVAEIRNEKKPKLSAKYKEAVGLRLVGFLQHELRGGMALRLNTA